MQAPASDLSPYSEIQTKSLRRQVGDREGTASWQPSRLSCPDPATLRLCRAVFVSTSLSFRKRGGAGTRDVQWGDVTPWLLQEAVGTTRRRIPASVAYLEAQSNFQLSSGMSTPPCTRTAPRSSIGAEGQHCAVTCSWGQPQSLLLVPKHLFPLYGFWEMQHSL